MGTDADRVAMLVCMLIASRNDGEVPNSPDYIMRVGYLSAPPDLRRLVDCGFLTADASDLLALASTMLADASMTSNNASISASVIENHAIPEERREEESRDRVEVESEGSGKPAPSADKRRGDDGFADFCATFPALWNSIAAPAGASAMLGDSLTPERRKAAKTRWGEKHFRENWRAALEAIPRLPFYCGQNDRGWRITPDYFLRPGSVVKLLERGTEPQQKGFEL